MLAITTAQAVAVADLVGDLPGVITNITFTSTSTTATVTGATTGLAIGQYFNNCPNVPNGTYISNLSGSTITLSQAATVSGTSVPTNVLTGGKTLIRAQDYIYPGAPLLGGSAPATPVIADSGVAITSGGFAASATLVMLSFQFPWGEGPLSAASNSITPTATHGLNLAKVVIPWPALGINIYTNVAAAGYQLVGQIQGQGLWNGANTVLTGPGVGPNAAYAPVTVTALMLAQYAWAQIFTGLSGQLKATGVSQIVGNGQANVCRVDTGTEVVFSADLDSTQSPNVGDYYAPAANAGGTALQTQTLTPCTPNSRSLACAQCVQGATSVTNALFKLITNEIKPGGY